MNVNANEINNVYQSNNNSANLANSAEPSINAYSNLHHIRDALLICEGCYESESYPKGLTQSNFELANFFNIVNPSESKLK